MSARTRSRGIALLAALLLGGCARTPTGEWDVAVISQTELERESAQLASAIDSQSLYSDPALAEYVGAVGARLVPHSAEPERPFEFRVLRTLEPAAFGLPGGQIYVSRGLLALATSESELAWVLAHEIGHVTARHARSQISKQQLIGFATTVVTAPLLFDTGQTLASAVPRVFSPSFSRDDERNADDLGARTAIAAGFDAACGVRILLAFRTYDALAARKTGGFFATHPEPGERYERMLEQMHLSREPACDSGYLTHVDGLRLDRDDGTYVDARGDLIVPALALKVERAEGIAFRENGARHQTGVVVDSADQVWVQLETVPMNLAMARDGAENLQTGSGHFDAQRLVLDQPESAGRPTVREIMLRNTKEGPRCEYHQWIEDGGRVYQLYSEYLKKRREATEPALERLAARLHAVPKEAIAGMSLVPMLELHVVAPDESLEKVAERYGVWSADRLAMYNDLAPGARLAAGATLKVAAKKSLAAAETR